MATPACWTFGSDSEFQVLGCLEYPNIQQLVFWPPVNVSPLNTQLKSEVQSIPAWFIRCPGTLAKCMAPVPEQQISRFVHQTSKSIFVSFTLYGHTPCDMMCLSLLLILLTTVNTIKVLTYHNRQRCKWSKSARCSHLCNTTGRYSHHCWCFCSSSWNRRRAGNQGSPSPSKTLMWIICVPALTRRSVISSLHNSSILWAVVGDLAFCIQIQRLICMGILETRTKLSQSVSNKLHIVARMFYQGGKHNMPSTKMLGLQLCPIQNQTHLHRIILIQYDQIRDWLTFHIRVDRCSWLCVAQQQDDKTEQTSS